MTQKELQYITAIAETGNISKAAEKLFVSQPSLSHSLQKVESDLGVPLFKRTAEGLKPTIAGEYYLKSAESILRTYKDLELRLSWLGDMKVGRLVIGTTAFLGSVLLPDILRVFNQAYPNIEVTIIEGDSQQVESSILKGMVDVGILHMPLINSGLRSETLVQERFLLAVPPGDPIGEKCYYKAPGGPPYIDLRLTDGQNYILTHPSQRTRQRGDAILQKAGATPHIKYLTKSIQTAIRMSGAGLGYTLVPQSYCAMFREDTLPALYYVEEEYEPYWQLTVCCSKDASSSMPVEELVRICNEIMPSAYDDSDALRRGLLGRRQPGH